MKCKICGVKLNNKTKGINNILNKKEQKKLKKLRKNQKICADCKMQILILDVIQ